MSEAHSGCLRRARPSEAREGRVEDAQEGGCSNETITEPDRGNEAAKYKKDNRESVFKHGR